MSLPILPSHRSVSNEDLIRYFYHCENDWGRQVAAEETTLDVGVALANPALAKIADANQLIDASLPDDMSVEQMLAEAEAHFAARGSRLLKWVMNPSAPKDRTQPLAEHIVAAGGFKPRGYHILYLAGQPAGPIAEASGLTIIPARAAFKHAAALAEEAAVFFNFAPVAESIMLHFEDPATDSVLAMKDGVPAGYASLMTMGEIGYIGEVFVSEKSRNAGIGRTLMSRTLEICARAIHRHVFIGVAADNAPAAHLYGRFGFKKIGEYSYYRRTGL
jgi:ribosomal-protein-alanine N-acetyltransferase